MQIVHNIDPSADTVIILKYPLAFFAVWTESDVGEDAAVEDAAAEDGVVEDDVVEDTVAEQATEIEPSTHEPTPSEVSTSEEEVHYHVSSRHLRLASTRFDSMLSRGNWKEGLPNEKDGLYHISAEDWDTEALLILLNVLHHHNRQVPRSVSLEMLAKIAVLIDYYDCAEAVEFCTERWVAYLRETTPIPSDLCRDLLLWMCIAWVLRLPHEFTQATAVAIKGDGKLSTLGLPITSCIERINEARIHVVGTLVARLHDLLEVYRDPNYLCPNGGHSFECGSILYGALSKQMKSAGLLEPYPVTPFSGLGFKETNSKLRHFKSPRWCYPGVHRSAAHYCNLEVRVTEIADMVISSVNGLCLKDFGRIEFGGELVAE